MNRATSRQRECTAGIDSAMATSTTQPTTAVAASGANPRSACAMLVCAVVMLTIASLLAACASGPMTRGTADVDAPWRSARQMVLVTTADWDAPTGTLSTWHRTASGWQQDGDAMPVSVGRSGAGWGLGLHPAQSGKPAKREGDGRAPAGVFAIGEAFGYAASGGDTALPYAQMQASSWCVDVVDSPLYNRIVDTRSVGAEAVEGASEPMRRDLTTTPDNLYRNGFVIEHNRQGRKGAGSCIFAHLWLAPGTPTAGCTAMAPAVMARLYAWLRLDQRPVFVLLPEMEYRRLKRAWKLP